LLPNAPASHRRNDSPLLRGLKWGASHLIRLSMRWAGTLLLLTWLMVAVSVFILTRLGTDFLPPFDEGSVQVNVVLPAGSSLAASNEVAGRVDVRLDQLRKTPDNPTGPVLHFVRRTGRGELDEHADPVNNTEYILTIATDTGRSRKQILKDILDELKEMKLGASIEDEQPLKHLIDHMLSGVRATIAIKIHGDDL